MVEAHARKFTSLPDMQNENDDLVQEGLIAVWEALRDGHHPSNEVVLNAMRDWCRKQRRKGLAGFDEVPHDVPALR